VNKRLRNTSTTTAAAIASTRPSVKDDVSAIVHNSNAVLDQKIDLITEGIDLFIASKLKELPNENALTIVNYILSMKNEINLSDNYRRLNIYALYRISKFFNNKKSFKELVRDDLLQYLDSLRKPENI
jgi:hypothetical protein